MERILGLILVTFICLCIVFHQGEARRERKTCPQNITPPDHGSIVYHRYSAQFHCNKNYIFYGSRSLRCNLRTGEWRNIDKTRFCRRKFYLCPEVTAPTHGSVHAPETTVGSEAYYTCDLGYTLDGVNTRICTEYKQWTAHTPTCISDKEYELTRLVDDLKTNVLDNYVNKSTDGPVAFSWTGDSDGAHLIFLIDGSASLSHKNFNDSIKFIKGLLDQFRDIIPGSLKVSAIGYSDVVTDEFKAVTIDEAKRKLDLFKPKQDSTRTDEALKKVKRMMSGDKSLKMVFVMTDGHEDFIDRTLTETFSVKGRGADIYAIGIGNGVNEYNLRKMVSKPEETHYVHIKDFDLLQDINQFIDNRTRNELCGMRQPKKGNHQQGASAHVAGGEEIERGYSPWTVFLKEEGRNVRCSGVAICKRWILTAAECLYDDNGQRLSKEDISVVAGTHDRLNPEDSSRTYEVSSFHVHEDYRPDNALYNIALIQLSSVLELHNFTRLVCLPEEDDLRVVGEYGDSGEMVGWGDRYIDESGTHWTQSFTPLRAAGVIGPITECEDNLEKRNMTFNSTIMDCLNGDDQDICKGDSGTGLVMDAPKSSDPHGRARAFVVGIASAGDPFTCTESSTAIESVKISQFIDWIRTTSGQCNNHR